MRQFFQACGNSVPQTAWLKKTEVYFLIALRTGGPSLRCWLSCFQLSPLSLAYNGPLLLCLLMVFPPY